MIYIGDRVVVRVAHLKLKVCTRGLRLPKFEAQIFHRPPPPRLFCFSTRWNKFHSVLAVNALCIHAKDFMGGVQEHIRLGVKKEMMYVVEGKCAYVGF